MDSDVPIPSIETDDPPISTNVLSTNTGTKTQESVAQRSLENALVTPLPSASPARSPRKTPKLQRDGTSPQLSMHSPSRMASTSSPLNPDRRSSTPLLSSRKSMSNLQPQRAGTPLRHLPSRHSSYNLSGAQPPSAIMPQEVEKKPSITAASIAKDHFQKEMLLHQEATDMGATTVVLIHDSCYGHRYSRPRTSKSLLSTIVERPERIHASVLGLATAYVRMGARHTGGSAPPHPDRDPVVSENVPFRIHKTSRSVPLSSAAATHVHGQKWMEELQIMCDSAEGKLALNGKELARPIGYGKDEFGSSLPKLHEGDLYLCSESLNALEGCLGGVCDAVDAVFSSGSTRRAFVCIRPPGHHCSSNYPSGFCWINNVHVGITHAAIAHGLTHAAIIDFDLHHGDGSQMIAWEHNRRALNLPKNAAPHKKTPIGYFSLHDINSYPCEMGDEDKVRNASLCIENAHGQSIWNIHLESWKSHADFWRLYEARYRILLDKTRVFLRHHTERLNNSFGGAKAKAAIFLSAGFDASEWEGEGMQRHKVNVPTDFYARFTADVVKLAEEEGLGVDGRVVSVLEGGYSDRALTSGVLSHVCGLAQDAAVSHSGFRAQKLSVDDQISLGMSRMDGRGFIREQPRDDNTTQFDSEWWNLQHLEALEALVNPPADQTASTKPQDKTGGNYTSPTQASTAKVRDQARERRSLSGQLERLMSAEPEPPPIYPDVDWATAAYELSRVLIPNDRQTLSCTHLELNAEATRVRRERQSIAGLPAVGEQRMQLRDRKAKAIGFDEEVPRPLSRGNNRRKTIAAVGELPDPSMVQDEKYRDGVGSAGERPRRRSSGASSVLAGFKNMQIGNATESTVSSRASSAVPEKSAKMNANKKARVVSAPRAQSAKPRNSPKKVNGTTPPVPRVPLAFTKPAAVSLDTREVVTDELQSSQEHRNPAPKVSTTNALDNLSSGIKKMSIKLKVPSPEENAARERKAAEDKEKKPRIPRKPTVPKATKSTKSGTAKASMAVADATLSTPSSMSNQNNAQELGITKVEPSVAPTEQELVIPKQEQEMRDLVTPALEASVPAIAQEVPVSNVDVQATYDSIMHKAPAQQQDRHVLPTELAELQARTTVANTHADHEGLMLYPSNPGHGEDPMAVRLVRKEDLQLPLPLTPASEKKTKADLPVFSSGSRIPFRKSNNESLNQGLHDAVASKSGDQHVSKLPGSIAGMSAARWADPASAPAASSNDWPVTVGSDASETSGPSRASEGSVWDVPETPRR